ncbi:hypothetical protein RvY_05295, partial [Ramazzottius varieornatus]
LYSDIATLNVSVDGSQSARFMCSSYLLRIPVVFSSLISSPSCWIPLSLPIFIHIILVCSFAAGWDFSDFHHVIHRPARPAYPGFYGLKGDPHLLREPPLLVMTKG